MTTPVSLAIAGTAFVLLGIGLVLCVTSLVRGNRDDVLVAAPISNGQAVTLPSSGEVLVAIDTPRTEADFRGFQIRLTDRQTGQAATMSYSIVTAEGSIYGIDSMRVPFGRMEAHAGVYRVEIAGLQTGRDYSRYRLILSRPYMSRMVLQIVGIVLCSVGMLGTLIWAAWIAGLMKPAQG